MLETANDNILQENIFIVLTLVEMVALSRVISIIHFNIALPMLLLDGSTHNMYTCGYDWSARSMGKAIDALYDGMVEIEQNGKKFLDEDFMNQLFSKIHVNENGEPGPLDPLV